MDTGWVVSLVQEFSSTQSIISLHVINNFLLLEISLALINVLLYCSLHTVILFKGGLDLAMSGDTPV